MPAYLGLGLAEFKAAALATLAPDSWTEAGCHALFLSHNWSTGSFLRLGVSHAPL